jgi:GNAT superfamily N-acetyltransferase
MHLVSLNANGLSLLNRGLLREGQILDAIMSKRAKRLNLYVIAVVVQKGFRRKGIAKKLWDVSRRYFLANQFYVNGIYGTVWTRAGRRLMERFSAQKLGRDRLGHEMVFIWTVDGKMLKLGDSKK